MSNITAISTRSYVATRNRLVSRTEAGQSTSEYGVAILVAIALALAVLALFTTGSMDTLLHGLLKKVLSSATGMVH